MELFSKKSDMMIAMNKHMKKINAIHKLPEYQEFVISISEQMVSIEHERFNVGGTTTRQCHDQVIVKNTSK